MTTITDSHWVPHPSEAAIKSNNRIHSVSRESLRHNGSPVDTVLVLQKHRVSLQDIVLDIFPRESFSCHGKARIKLLDNTTILTVASQQDQSDLRLHRCLKATRPRAMSIKSRNATGSSADTSHYSASLHLHFDNVQHTGKLHCQTNAIGSLCKSVQTHVPVSRHESTKERGFKAR
jgi:hypothetical protein